MLRATAVLALAACGSNARPVAIGNKTPTSPYAAAIDDVLGFLPADSEIVVGIDGVQLRKSALWTQFSPTLIAKMGSELGELRTACGFDPVQTVERITVGVRMADDVVGVVVVRGVGASTMGCVRTYLGKEFGGVVDDKGVLVIALDDHEKSAWTMVGSTLIIQLGLDVGHDSMQAVLGAGAPLRASRPFMDVYGQLESGATVWGVISGKSKLFDDAGAKRPRTLLGTVTVADHLVIAGKGVFDTADVAHSVNQDVQDTFQQNRGFTELANSVVDGNAVSIRVSMGAVQLRRLLDTI
jgi:hypothetical protein